MTGRTEKKIAVIWAREDRDMQNQIAALTAKVAELEKVLTNEKKWRKAAWSEGERFNKSIAAIED